MQNIQYGKRYETHNLLNEVPVLTQEISEFGFQFVSLSGFHTLTHMSMIQIGPTCHCDMSVKTWKAREMEPKHRDNETYQIVPVVPMQ